MNKFTLPFIFTLFAGVAIYLGISSFESEKITYHKRTDKFPLTRSWKGGAYFNYIIRRDPETGSIPISSVLEARNESKSFAQAFKTEATFTWEEMGPDNFGGRTRALIVDQTVEDGSRLYAGSVSGGLFVSNNFGGQWQTVDPQSDCMGISALAQGPDGTIWIGTGSTFEWNSVGGLGSGSTGFIGSGLYKLSPGSSTIENVASASPTLANSSTAEWIGINDVVVNQNTGRIYVGQNKGLRISDDGGVTWTNPIILLNGLPEEDQVDDIELADDGTVIVAVDGVVFRSTTGNYDTYSSLGSAQGFTTARRINVAISPVNNNIVWANTSNSDGECKNLYKSTDKGATWTLIPQLDDFNYCRDQGWYDLMLAPSVTNENTVYLGGIDIYKYNGAWTHLTQWNALNFLPYYVHADQHSFAHSHANNIEYFTNDGGVFFTQDGGQTFLALNRGYNVAQFYTLGYDEFGRAIGGTQDNGTIAVGLQGYYPLEGTEVNGGDGLGCDASNLNNKVFASTPYGAVVRGTDNGGFGLFCGPWGCVDGNNSLGFFTSFRLWETYTSEDSRDSVTFIAENGENEYVIVQSDGVTKNYSGTIQKIQESGKFSFGSIKFTAGNLELTDTDQNEVLEGNGTGTFNYSTGEYTLQFATAPAANINLKVSYQMYFNPGDKLYLKSLTPDVELRGQDFSIEYTLPNGLQPGDSVKVQDPIQSLFAFGSHTGRVYITRDGLRDKDPLWWEIPTSVGSIKTLEFSKDGNHLFIGSFNGNLFRLSNLDGLHEEGDSANVTVTKIFGIARAVTGIGVDPYNPDNVVISVGSYNNTDNVYYTNQATTATGVGTFVSIQGNLPAMPVYDALICNDDNKTILVGTEHGVYMSSLLDTANWTDANNGFPNVPVHEIRQQTFPFEVTDHEGVIYASTHGRGIWRSTTLLSSENIKVDLSDNTFVSDLTIYPNPSSQFDQTFVKVNMGVETIGELNVYNIQGKRIYTSNVRLQEGTNRIPLQTSFGSGNYFVSLEAKGETKVGKIIITK